MKKVLIIIGLCLLAGYLVFSALFFEKQPKEQVCERFEVVSTDDSESNLVDMGEIEKFVADKGLSPVGKLVKDINTYDIEQAILENKLVKKANVFVTGSGGIRVEIENRVPVLRIINKSGESYYIDNEAQRVPLSKIFTADLPLATGAVTEEFAKNGLLEFAVFLSKNEFWDNFVEQIVVVSNDEVKLIPRVGKQEIILGKIDNYQEKLNKLRIFYQKGLSEAGWNQFSAINLKYDKQVVCTKR